jgi:hypothetical protein
MPPAEAERDPRYPPPDSPDTTPSLDLILGK